ncbi:MAG: hypothetical protein M3083_03325 [Actinomycetota bacterium]|nr:hypothetical protein [Actinomycetota bacterium]
MPVGFWLALPEGWFTLDVNPKTAAASVDRLIAHRLLEAPQLGDEVASIKHTLTLVAAEAQRVGIEFSAGYAVNAGDDLVITANLGISVHTIGEGVSVQAIEQGLHARGDAKSAIVESGAGTAVKVRGRDRHSLPGGPGVFEVATWQYFVPVPNSNRLALLSFTTPTLALADDLDELFDAMVSSFRFTWVEQD